MIAYAKHESVVFLLGAGFNTDAASEAGNPIVCRGRAAHYPVARDLLNVCFDTKSLPHGKSIEDLFQDSIDKGEWRSLDKLFDVLMEADYYITHRLKSRGSHHPNAYSSLLGDFAKSHLLTFNYDSLLEIMLLADRSWCPKDGYGAPVEAYQKTIRCGKQPVEKSNRLILHLHGSLCVYTVTSYSEEGMLHEQEPEYYFDPDALGNRFYPFRGAWSLFRTPVRERVIAPIPDKSLGLKGKFIKATYDKASEILKSASQVVSIGYSFNEYDRSSYDMLLSLLTGKSILIVTPNAESIRERLFREYTNIQWEAQSMTFKEWVNSKYPGVI